MLEYNDMNTHWQSLWFLIWTLWLVHISHPQAEEPWDQRTVVVCVTGNRETLSELSLTQTQRWHARSVAVHRSDPTAPPLHHTARAPRQTRGYWARARSFVKGQAQRKSPGKTLSCHANEAVWIWIWIWGWHRGWEKTRDGRIDQSKSERGRG